ncbi:MAG: hypothetical protein M3081_13790, partial [Gemmatimonadota bacterium]|nr:hypothetical protein [Gemmatimonadota bacterium]
MPRPQLFEEERGDGRIAWVRARWLRARARNVRRQPFLIAVIATTVFLIALLSLVVAPRGSRRITTATRAQPVRPDTASPNALLRSTVAASADVASRLAAAREHNAQRALALRPASDTFPAEVRARRDSLIARRVALSQLLGHAETAPLPASYHALAASPDLAADPRVKILLDSLTEVERSREAYSATGLVDAYFMSLTARGTEIGKSIRAIGAGRRDALRAEAEAISPPMPARTSVAPPADTVPLLVARDSVALQLEHAQLAAQQALARNRAADSALVRQREAASAGAPPIAMLGAALAIGFAVAFAVALAREIARPRVGNAREAERATGAPVLARIDTRSMRHELSRRRADRDISPLIDKVGDNYRAIYTQLVDPVSRRAAVAVTGDDPLTTAVIAINMAAAAASQAPATLLLDADAAHPFAANIARVRPSPGLTDVIAARVDWSETIASALVGRDVTIDVLPSGHVNAELSDRELAVALRLELNHLRARYDTVVVSAPRILSVRAAEGVGGAVICARTART